MSDSEPGSTVHFKDVPRRVSRRRIREFAARLGELTGGREFCCLVADDKELRRLNRRFLGKNYPTDVLSFPSSGPGGPLGDIAISFGRVLEQAGARGHSEEQEIAVLMLHGVLHLLGYNHESDRGRMARMETRWRRKLGLPSGLVERSGQ
jgi:probable rRNA maturation factor